MINKVIILGGGSAGFMAAVALKVKLPAVDVLVIRSKDIGIIGVGEGSTIVLTRFLHEYLHVGLKKFHEVAQPTWKLGLKFFWGRRPHFHYSFGIGPDAVVDNLPRAIGYYCDEGFDYIDLISAMMTHDRVFARSPTGGPVFHDSIAYHFENEKYVSFLEGYAAAVGVRTLDDTVLEVKQDEGGVSGLVLQSGATETADLYVDASGFASVLLSKALAEPFVSFSSSLFCDRAVIGGWARGDEVIKPYTTCETMDSGWCWQIEHEHRINRGYVYASPFISDEEAEREFRSKNPKVDKTRIVRFVSGCYQRAWVQNVVAVGNASGFVEPLEATALGVIAMQSRLLADTLLETGRRPGPAIAGEFNEFHRRNWEGIRGFIALHYRFNDRLDTPFWRHCRAETDLGRSLRFVEYYRENGPSRLWAPTLLEPFDSFQPAGYTSLLLGQQVPYRNRQQATAAELAAVANRRKALRESALSAMTVREAIDVTRLPNWRWHTAARP